LSSQSESCPQIPTNRAGASYELKSWLLPLAF